MINRGLVVLVYQNGIAKAVLVDVNKDFIKAYTNYMLEETTLTKQEIRDNSGLKLGTHILYPMDKKVWETLDATSYSKLLSYGSYTTKLDSGELSIPATISKLDKGVTSFIDSLLVATTDDVTGKDILSTVELYGNLFSPAEYKKVLAYAKDEGIEGVEEQLKNILLWDKYISVVDMLTTEIVAFNFGSDLATVSYDSDNLLDMLDVYCDGNVDETDTEYGVINSLINLLLLVEGKTTSDRGFSPELLALSLHTSVLRV